MNSVNVVAQTPNNFEIKLKQIEYINVDAKEHSYVDAKSTNNVLNLSKNFNHVFVSLEDDPNIQYAYKVTGVAALNKWKNTGSEINIVGLSTGEYRLSIRGERNGIISNNSLEYYINIKPPFYLTWWGISIFIIMALVIFYVLISLESKLREERRDRNLEVSYLEGRAYRAQMTHILFSMP